MAKSKFVVVMLLGALFAALIAVVPDPAGAGDVSSGDLHTSSATQAEQRIAEQVATLVNAERNRAGLPAASYYPDWAMAQLSAELMRQNRELGFFVPDQQKIDFYSPITTNVGDYVYWWEMAIVEDLPARTISTFVEDQGNSSLVDPASAYLAVGAACDPRGFFYVAIHLVHSGPPPGAAGAAVVDSPVLSGRIESALGEVCEISEHIPSGSANSYAHANLEELEAGPGQIRIHGWSYDPDLPTYEVVVHVYAFFDGVGDPVALDTPVVLAGDFRPDVNAVLGIDGDHGFNRTLTIRPGNHRVCAYSLSVDSNGVLDDLNELIGCEYVTIAADAPARGVVDDFTRNGNFVAARGWAYDLDSELAALDVGVYVDGVHKVTGLEFANIPRPDINKIVGIAGDHGYDIEFDVGAGSHEVCIVALGKDTSGQNDGTETTLGCKVV